MCYILFYCSIDKVDAIAFGVKCDRVVPCIRVFTQFNGEKSELIYDVARQLSTAVLNQKNVLLSVEDCTHYIEVGDYEDSKIYPEELMGYPGEQFSVHGGTGTIGYYLRADLQLNIGGTTKSIAQHFAITCSHCVFPNRIIDTLRTAARTNPSVHQKIQDYPFAQLYEHMWEHSSHRKHHYGFACTSHLLPQGHPGAYSGFPYENELLMIKGAISCSEVRDIVNENVIYEDHHNSHLPHRKYTYVTSKYGMIPKHFSMPLPNYIFNHYGNIYHIPFSVDVAALKVEDAGLDDKHCLENIIESTVDGSYNELRCCNIFGSTYRQQICPHYGLLKLPESQKDLPLAVENVSIQQQISPLEESLPSQFLITTTPKKKGSAFDQMYRLGKTAVANGRNMFGLREQTKLQLQVMSNQHDGRNLIRTLDIGNDDFCLEFVHRNQTNRQQKRCFPTVKWKKKSTEFIKRGDSGSSLFIVTKDENNIDKPVLLGVVGSANTATRVDFVKDVLSHDLLTYMTSELKKCLKQMEDEPFNLLCDTIERRVQFKSELSELNSSPQTERKNICSRIQEKHRFVKSLETSVGLPINDTQWGSVSFRLRECIRDCKI